MKDILNKITCNKFGRYLSKLIKFKAAFLIKNGNPRIKLYSLKD